MEQRASDLEKSGKRVETQRSIAREAQSLYSADFCAVQALNPITGRFYGQAVLTDALNSPDAPLQARLESLAQRVVGRGGMLVERATEGGGETAAGLEGMLTVAAVALHTQREKSPVAVLIMGFRHAREFSPADEESLSGLSTAYSPRLENAWLLGRYREVVKIGQEINQTLKGPKALFNHLYEKVSTIIDTEYFFMLGVYHQENGTLDYHMAYRRELKESIEGRKLTGLSAYVITSKQPVIEVNRSRNPTPPAKLMPLIDESSPDPESYIFVPLIFRDEPLGVLSIQNLKPGAYDSEDVQIMYLLGNQVALAMSDLRLFEYLEALNQTGRELTSQLTSDELLDVVVLRIKETTKADIVTLYPYVHEDDKPIVERFGNPRTSGTLREPQHVSKTVREDDIAWLMLQKEKPVWAADSAQLFALLGGDPEEREGFFEKREKILSTAALALRIEGVAVGVLFINYRNPQSFNAAQRNLISGLANFATIAINNYNRFIQLLNNRLAELELLRKIDQDIGKYLKLKDVLEAILKGAAKRVGGKDCALFLFNRNTRDLVTEVSLGKNHPKYERLTMPAEGRGLVPWAYRERAVVRVGNVKTDPQFRDIYEGVVPDTLSELDAPLMDGEEVVGVMNFESPAENAFTSEHEEFLKILAGQAVLAIKNAQIYERAEAGVRSREAYRQVARQIITQQDNYGAVIDVILREARKLVNAEIGIFQQYENGRPGDYRVEAESAEGKAALYSGIDIEGVLDHGILRHVARTGRPYTTVGQDAQKDKLYKGSPHIHSESAVPLLDEDGMLMGVIDIESLRPFAFEADDEKALAMFAELSVIAIKNARNYSRAVLESERAKVKSQRFQLLYEAGRELSKITDPGRLEKAYDIVAAEVGQFTDGEVVIRRYDPATESLVLAWVERPRPLRPLPAIPKSVGVNGQAARERRVIRIDDMDNLPEGVAEPVGDDPSVKALVVVPLLFESAYQAEASGAPGGRDAAPAQEPSYYGNLVLSHERANSFDDDDINLLKGLARQLAITIHRLEIVTGIKEAERSAKEHQVMSAVGQSAMGIAHMLGNWLKPVELDIKNIRGILAAAGIEHSQINAELDRVGEDVKSLLSMASALRQRIAGLGPLGRERSAVSVRELVLEAVGALYKPENVEIRLEVRGDLPDVGVNPGQIIDILSNLLTNAVEVMPGGGAITIRGSRQEGQAGAPSPYVLVEVSDTGPGIPEENQAKVFNLFFSTKRSSGFGLWSARQYARANGGDLTLASVDGAGTTFTLKLPVMQGKEVDL